MSDKPRTPARIAVAYLILLAFALILLLPLVACGGKVKAQITSGTVNKGAML